MAVDVTQMKAALKALDALLPEKMELLIGGGAAFVLAHQIPLATMDIDGLPYKTGIALANLDSLIKKIAKKLNLPNDWLNPYFSTFTYSLPKDYSGRLVPVYKGKKLLASALGKEDLLIMKCFAGREKDILHARALLKKGLKTQLVSNHLSKCLEEGIPKAQEANDFFYDCCGELGIDV